MPGHGETADERILKDLPEHCTAYQRTPEFTEASVPAGLLNAHRTKQGTWARIVVLDGRLRYRILEPELEDVQLEPGRSGVVEPGVRHEVLPVGRVRFYVEFCRE